MHNFKKALKDNLNVYVFISIIIVGSIISYLNLSITFNLSLSSKNQKAVIAQDKLNKFPEGLLLVSQKHQNKLTENDIQNIGNWLDEKGKSKSKINFNNDRFIISLNYFKDFDLADYINKLLLIPNKKIQNLKIKNKEKLIIIEFF